MSDTEEDASRNRGAAGRHQAPQGENRRPINAANVSQRWWEGGNPAAGGSPPPPPAPAGATATPPAGGFRSATPPPPPPPPPVAPQAPARSSAADLQRIQQLEQELAAARDETSALHEMLEDLPEIFERKFRQRLHGILEQQQLLLADNQMLRERLFALQPAAPEPETRPARLLPPAAPAVEADPEPEPQRGRPALRSLLQGMFRFNRDSHQGRQGAPEGEEPPVSDPADERPRAA